MTRTVPLAVLIGSTLAGVALGALLGAELHVDVSVPARIAEVRGEAHRLTVPSDSPTLEAQREERRVRRDRRERRERRDFRADWHIDRDELLDTQNLTTGRVLLHRDENGEFDGYRLSAIRRGSFADRHGIKNGDIIHRINGLEMNGMEAAMQAYNDLQDETRFVVDLTRRGEPMTLTYEVR